VGKNQVSKLRMIRKVAFSYNSTVTSFTATGSTSTKKKDLENQRKNKKDELSIENKLLMDRLTEVADQLVSTGLAGEVTTFLTN